MGEIKQERCLALEGWGDEGVYGCVCVCVRVCGGVDLPLAMHDAVVR